MVMTLTIVSIIIVFLAAKSFGIKTESFEDLYVCRLEIICGFLLAIFIVLLAILARLSETNSN